MPPDMVKAEINKLDCKKTELMKCAETRCKKKCAGKLPCSPRVSYSYWFKRLRLFRRICRHKIKPLGDPRNLSRQCKVLAKDCTIQDQIKQLETEAPELRCRHVRQKIEEVIEQQGNSKKARELLHMLEREESRGNFHEVKITANEGKGRKVFSVETKNYF
eukprot:scaffold1876_cov58-Cyclotella_meneghiniana.AAC.3